MKEFKEEVRNIGSNLKSNKGEILGGLGVAALGFAITMLGSSVQNRGRKNVNDAVDIGRKESFLQRQKAKEERKTEE